MRTSFETLKKEEKLHSYFMRFNKITLYKYMNRNMIGDSSRIYSLTYTKLDLTYLH